MKKFVNLILLSALLPLSAFGQSVPADLVLLNGKIFTADVAKPFAEAVAISGERIVAVGTSAEVEKFAGARARRIDLQGRVVTPGFNDAHIHFSVDPQGFNLQFKTMEPSWEETRAAVEAATKQTSPGTWIFGSVGANVVLNEPVTRFALDRLAPNHPVFLRAYYGHGYIVNTKAMPLLQIGEEEPDPVGGWFERVADSKKINGRIWEYAEWKPNRILSEMVSDEETIRQMRLMADEAIRYGITSLQMFSTLPVERFARLLVKADLPVRAHARPFALTSLQGRDLTDIRQLTKLRFPNSKISISGIKWILDGTPYERGAALRKSYDDRPDWRGKLNFTQSEIAAMVKESLDLRQPLLLHCAGDRCAAAVLNALESYESKVDWVAKRVRIEHGDGVISDLIPLARKLGVVVVQNPAHFAEPQVFQPRWGKEMQPLRSLIEGGIPVALGSDGPMNPFLNIMFATIHSSNPKEAITREQAVRAYTYGSAFAEFVENEKGTIIKGKLADLVVLSQDIFVAPTAELPKTNSVVTIVGGKIVYDANVLK
jgi:predicted amidohydrolase YtcJ